MGNMQSNVTKQTLADYTNVVNSTVANVYSSAAQTCASGNNFTLNTGQNCGWVPGFELLNGSLNVTQTAGSNCQLNSQTITNLSAQFQTQLTNNTQQFIEQNSQNKQGWFATAFSLQVQGASNTTEIMTQLSNFFNSNFTSLCSAVDTAFNNATVNLCGVYDGSNFNFNQNALVTALTSCVNQNVINEWTSNQVLNNLWQQTDQKLASTQSGFSLSWIFIIIIAIVALIVIIGLIFLFAGLLKNKGGNTTTAAPSTSTTTSTTLPKINNATAATIANAVSKLKSTTTGLSGSAINTVAFRKI